MRRRQILIAIPVLIAGLLGVARWLYDVLHTERDFFVPVLVIFGMAVGVGGFVLFVFSRGRPAASAFLSDLVSVPALRSQLGHDLDREGKAGTDFSFRASRGYIQLTERLAPRRRRRNVKINASDVAAVRLDQIGHGHLGVSIDFRNGSHLDLDVVRLRREDVQRIREFSEQVKGAYHAHPFRK